MKLGFGGKIQNTKDLELWKGSKAKELKRQSTIKLSLKNFFQFKRAVRCLALVQNQCHIHYKALKKKEFQGEIMQFKELCQMASMYNLLTIPTHCSFTFSNPHMINLAIINITSFFLSIV
jgi:hypothetical protein